MTRALFPVLPLLLSFGCSETASRPTDQLTFLEVSVSSVLPGSEKAPANFVEEDETVTLFVRALDRNADPLAVDTTLSIRIRPGRIVEEDGDLETLGVCPGSTSGRAGAPLEVAMIDGEWTGDVTYRYAFGPTRVWIGDDLGSESHEASFATGVSEALWYEKPTLAEMQRTDDPETNPLDRQFVDFRTEDRQVIVTTLGAAGFWVADTSDSVGAYAQTFIYSYSAPDDIEEGDRLSVLAGGVQEYLQSTQISFPDYKGADDGTWEVPEASVITDAILCDDAEMEKYEAGLIRAEGVQIPSTFGNDTSDEDYADYIEYGQWPVQWPDGSCKLYLDTSTSIPNFLPTDWAGAELDFVQGMVSQVWDKWVLVVRGSDDLPSKLTDTTTASKKAARPSRPRSRTR
jgi:hypothetical protein